MLEGVPFDIKSTDLTTRAVMADWLQENGEDPATVKAIRRQTDYAISKFLPLEISIPIRHSVSMEFILVPPGSFLMGAPEGDRFSAPEERPQHPVLFRKHFWISKNPVTQEQYHTVTFYNPSSFHNLPDSQTRPVENITWNGADLFCYELKKFIPKTLSEYVPRLPTETEWEYACRAGTTTRFPWGDSCDGTQANVDADVSFPPPLGRGKFVGQTTPVGSYPPNLWLINDMIGNVEEWCFNTYSPNEYSRRYSNGVYIADENHQDAPSGGRIPLYDEYAVIRGGSWCSIPHLSSTRDKMRPSAISVQETGFRVVLSSCLFSES